MEVYLHVRVLLSMILGLGVGHLLRGVSRIVQHPRKYKIYWVHLIWTLFLFLYLIHFWWWEFYLQKVAQWTFPSLLLHRDVRHDSLSVVFALLSRRNGRI